MASKKLAYGSYTMVTSIRKLAWHSKCSGAASRCRPQGRGPCFGRPAIRCKTHKISWTLCATAKFYYPSHPRYENSLQQLVYLYRDVLTAAWKARTKTQSQSLLSSTQIF